MPRGLLADCRYVSVSVSDSGGRCVVHKATANNGCINKTEHLFTSATASQPIWLDDVTCTGLEQSLVECFHRNWGVSDCRHKEDAGCMCKRAASSSSSSSANARPTPSLSVGDRTRSDGPTVNDSGLSSLTALFTDHI